MKPSPRPVNDVGIPAALKQERRWSVWRYVLDDKSRWIKKPLGKSNDPSTWLTFKQALTLYRRRGWDGLLFALGNGWAGIDMDDCARDGVPLYRGAAATVEKFGAYCETSPSGEGLKIIGRAACIGFEVVYPGLVFTRWQSPRFFTITGHGSGDPTVDITDALNFYLPPEPEPVFAGRVRATRTPTSPPTTTCSS